MNKLIRCINCDEIFLKTPFDQWPEYKTTSKGQLESFRVIEKDDFQDFLKHHNGHRFEELKIMEDSFISEKDYAEPVKTSYFKATNGKESFVVKKFRGNIDEPLKYQLIRGDYSLRCVSIEVQSKEIIKQLIAEFKTNPISQDKIDAFIELLQYIAKSIDIKKLERISEESYNPSEIYYKIDDIGLAFLLRNCRNIFKEQEYINIEEFIYQHKDNGVLLLKATYQIQIMKKVNPQKKITATPMPLEMTNITEKS